MNFVERLRGLRSEKGLTQKDFAKAVGIPFSTYKTIESGAVTPTVDKVVLFADFFDVSIDYLVGRSDSRSCKF